MPIRRLKVYLVTHPKATRLYNTDLRSSSHQIWRQSYRGRGCQSVRGIKSTSWSTPNSFACQKSIGILRRRRSRLHHNGFCEGRGFRSPARGLKLWWLFFVQEGFGHLPSSSSIILLTLLLTSHRLSSGTMSDFEQHTDKQGIGCDRVKTLMRDITKLYSLSIFFEGDQTGAAEDSKIFLDMVRCLGTRKRGFTNPTFVA